MNGRVWVGVDPGRSGAMALIEERSEGFHAEAWPTMMLDQKHYNLTAICNWFSDWKPRIELVTVEQLAPLPAMLTRKGGGAAFSGGAFANFSRGESQGWFWMLTALGIPFLPVVPQTWQRAMHVGAKGSDTKSRSIDTALRLFPGVSLRESGRAKKNHDGLADALCIAEFGRRHARTRG